jgi:hypothetical protein
MSKIAISGASTGTATFTIESPATSTNRTLTLPDNTGTILTNATTAGFPAGSVLQVVEGTTSTAVAVTSASYADSGLSATITPTSATSKILVIVNQNAQYVTSSSSQYGNGLLKLVRASTSILEDTFSLYIEAANSSFATSANAGRITICKLDSPATTSSTTYKTQQAAGRSGAIGTMTTQLSSNPSTIILMEIAA